MLMDMLAANPTTTTATTNASFLHKPLSLLGSVLRGQTPSPDMSTTTTTTKTITHDTPPLDNSSSRPASAGSDTTADKVKKPSRRSKTSYNIARPINTRSKRHVHLQLHQVITSQRPKPAYDVVPFSLLPQRSTRHLAHFFNTRERLGPNDLLVVKAGAYTSQDEQEKSRQDDWASRDVVGVLSTRKSDNGLTETTDICISDGFSRWSVADMPNGGYEFTSTDEHAVALKARWVLKPAHARRTSASTVTATAPEDKKFTFSTISSDSRRHPIIATMTRSRIDVMDTYTIPSATSPPTPNATSSYTQSPTTPLSIDSDSFADALAEKLPIETNEALRNLILVSGVWLASREFASDGSSLATIPALTRSNSVRQAAHRACSMSMLEGPRSPSPASTVEEKRRSFPRMLKASIEGLSHAHADAPPSPASTKTAAKASPVVTTRSRRANSTGTAIHSITGSARKRYGLAFEDETLVESTEERQMKRSIELLRIRELQLPSPIERPSVETSRPDANQLPSPIVIPPSPVEPASPAPLLDSPLLSPPLPDTKRPRKTQSTYAPITTTGMWDSGVVDGPGLKKRPTSMFVMNEKKRKQEKKGERSKSKDSKTRKGEQSSDHSMGVKRKSDWYVYKIKLRLKDMFHHKERA
ncbi:hypothetical protein COCVIDRAFT_12407 [Bipolaris victoriae FI3]|uniref:Uncharacterized protein n=1 Tax=Bipolaris victoriae (strain FI3) TaxID=930091 RepID=W7ELU3_BIPV3|nr:hypothetical protein COCVIDRAFT_12407 [Bipolaris victoriae FI3]